MSGAPSGTVTFLFTDVVSSTRLWEERDDEMRSALARHDEVVRAAIAAHDGHLFSIAGDGFGAAFARAADAVAAAEAAQTALVSNELIAVRMGINTGEVQERDGNYFGSPVNRAARLMAAGHGGQVLIAGVTAELVPGLTLTNLGERRLRDLGAPMSVWQLGTSEFPPLHTLDALPGNLPVQRTTFIGRTDEIKELSELVGRERLVTLTGPGGVGKTRLALQLAAEAAPEFADGAWFVPLASLEEGALVAPTLLDALGVPERRGESALDTLRHWIGAHTALIVLDNCEHLLADVTPIVDAIADSPSITVLATSQAPLGVRGEHVWPVAPLSSERDLARDSVELFVDRARMARAGFALNADNEAAVVEICDRLDHLPLAIELAAARMRGMAPADVARRLDQRLRLLSSSDRGAPGRHQTLDAAVRWSYELLAESEQRLFDRLSVFAGPFTLEAAEAVAGGDGVDEWEVVDGVLALVDKSLVVAHETATGVRYRLLETMRSFGTAMLVQHDVDVRYRNRHASYYTEFVLSRQPQLHGAGDVQALDEIEPELENIRVALRHAAADRHSSRFEDLYCAMDPLWIWRGRGAEGMSWGNELVDRTEVEPRARIVALGFAAFVVHTFDLDLGTDMAYQAVAIADATGAAPPLVALGLLSIGAMMQARNDATVELADRALAQLGDEPELFVRAVTLGQIGAALAICRDRDGFEVVSALLAALVDELGNECTRGYALNTMTIGLFEGTDDAGDQLREAFVRNEEAGNHTVNSSTAMFLAVHELRTGEVVAAAEWARRSLQLAVEHGPSYVAQAVDVIVGILRRASPHDAAVLLGALRAHRGRKHQVGTQVEIDSEDRFESSLRRRLGDEFERCYTRGGAFDEAAMNAFALDRLEAVVAN